MAKHPGGRDVLIGRQAMQIVQLDAVVELGHHRVGQDVEVLDIAGILLVAITADALQAVGKKDAQLGGLVGGTALARRHIDDVGKNK